MKRLFLAFVAALGLLAVVLVVRAVRLRSHQLKLAPEEAIRLSADSAAQVLAGAIRFETYSFSGPEASRAAFEDLHRYLEQAFPVVHRTLRREVVGELSLLYTWPGTKPNLQPIVLMAHQDIVPVEAGTESGWRYPPFGGRVAEGFVWGRGALDDKVGVVGILAAVEHLLGEGFRPARTVYLAFGHDEETGGGQGAAKIAARLKEQGITPALILDEGGVITSGIVPMVRLPVALVGIAEKGYLSVELKAIGQSGHSSLPPAQTAIGILSAALTRLERSQMPARLDPATRELFRYLGPEMAFPARVAVANLWLFGPVLERILEATASGRAMLRTTTAITMIRGGIKDNVIPRDASAVVNFRVLPGDSIAGVLDHVRRVVADSRITITRYGETATEPSRESSTDTEAFQAVHRAIARVFPDVVVAPTLLVAGTDTKHYQGIGSAVYRFAPLRIAREDLDRVHGSNERIAVSNFAEAIRFYRQLILEASRDAL